MNHFLGVFVALCFLPFVLWSVELSTEEREYLHKLGTIKACVDPDWEPFETLNQKGEYSGIGADLLALVAKKLGIAIEVLPTKDWDESIALSKEGTCQIISFLNQTPARSKWLLFTEPHFSDVNVFITREEHPFIANPADLVDKTIVFPKGTAMEELIRKDYPNLKIINTNTEMEAFKMVSDKKADMAMRSLIVAAYTIKKEGFFNLKISGQLPNYTNQLRIGIIKSEPILRDILNKGVMNISNKDRENIVNQHVIIKAQTVIDHTLMIQLSIIFIFIILGFIYRQYEMNRYAKKLLYLSQTDLLTGLYNRTKIDQALNDEMTRAKRNGYEFSILLFDVDFFKKVNDTFGHQMGDKVLISLAKSAQESLRTYDIIGRWGGEEFLVLCPECGNQEAMIVAERLRKSVEEADSPTQCAHTISIGVATMQQDDTPHTLVSRADDALYQAKHQGRNQVCRISF